jgi:hypothetical protein
VSDFRLPGRSAQRLNGAYYTRHAPAEVMARWVIRSTGDRILEPAFGDGSFLRALVGAGVSLFGAELAADSYTAAVAAGLLPADQSFLGDFLALKPFDVDAIIGNPPYVRLRYLPAEQRARALHVAEAALGQRVGSDGSVWMPFVLHALRFLRRGGRMALVLPHELTYVRYARPLWKLLGESFADLRVVRVHERLFPEILQEVVVLFADGFGGTTDVVRYQTLERADQFAASADAPFIALPIAEIAAGRRTFVEALLPETTRGLLADVLAGAKLLPELCTVRIGYVTGDRKFFHPSASAVRDFDLPAAHLWPALTSGRQIRTCGLRTSNPHCVPERLFRPSAAGLTAGERRYVVRGEAEGIHNRYKCAIREPWYVVPFVPPPDVVISVFAERPVLAINDAGYLASNSLLCGYLRAISPEAFAAAWYTSLTLLQCELQVHALGGGVLILIPGEIARIRLPKCRARRAHLRRIDELLSAGDLEGAYRCGDDAVLRRQLGMSAADIEQIRAGIGVLRHWRNSASTPVASRPRARVAGSGSRGAR